MGFIRFVLATRHPSSGVNDGFFGVAYKLRDDPSVHVKDRESLKQALAWFDEHLPKPKRFNRSKSKGYYRRNTKGIAWFRDTATDCVAKMHQIKNVIEANGYHVATIKETRVGYIVYEDAFQVVAETEAREKTLFPNEASNYQFGGQFAAVAGVVLDRAREKGIGPRPARGMVCPNTAAVMR